MTPEERATAVCRDSRWTIEPWKYDLIVAAIRGAVEAREQEIINLLESRRVRVLLDKHDPSYTEHFAELQTEVNWRLKPTAPIT